MDISVRSVSLQLLKNEIVALLILEKQCIR